MINLFIEILTAFIIFYNAIIYGSKSIAIIGFAELTFLALSYIYLFFITRKKEFEIKIPIAVAAQGEYIELFVDEEKHPVNGFGDKIRYKIEIKNSLGGKKEMKWLTAGVMYSYLALAPGTYEFTLKKVRVYDFSGLIFITKNVDKIKNVEVIPEIFAIPIRISDAVRNFFGDADVYDDLRPGYDVSEMFGIRNFRAGDKIQSIHWKLSAKSDELIVKENGLPKACAIAIIANTSQKMNLKQNENFVRLIVAFSFSLMDQNCPHYVAWYSKAKKDIIRARIDDEESFYIFLTYFLKADHTDRIDAEFLYTEKYRMEKILHLVVINSDLTIKRGHDVIGKPKGKNLKKEMESLELVI